MQRLVRVTSEKTACDIRAGIKLCLSSTVVEFPTILEILQIQSISQIPPYMHVGVNGGVVVGGSQLNKNFHKN